MLRAAVYSPTAVISTANAIRSVSGRARVAILAPSRLPITAAAVNTPMIVQSMSMPVPARATSDVALFMAMTNREVPTATGIGKSSASTSAGTTRNPPPTPKNPVINPTATAAMSTFAARGQAQTKPRAEGDDRHVQRHPVTLTHADAGTGGHPAAGEHQGRDGEHQHGEPGEQHIGRHGQRQPCPGNGSRGPQRPEDDPLQHPDMTVPAVREHPEHRGHPDDDQRPGGRRAGVHPQQVHQRRDGQDRPAAAERTQAEPDQQSDRDRDDQHGRDRLAHPAAQRF